jgi:uncharacterized iron-regulated protein
MLKTSLPNCLLLLALFATLTGCSITHVMRVEDRKVIETDTMIGELRAAPVILVGERHDAASHHRLQLDIIRDLKAQGTPFAIGMEMFETGSQKALDAWVAGKAPEQAFRKVFAWNWRNIPWNYYQDILYYARDNRIPLVALNASRDIVQKVSQQGASSLSPEDLLQLPAGIDPTVSEAYLAFMGSAYPAHGRSGAAFRSICEAQMLRNRVMARRIGDYLAEHPGSRMVVLAGGAHVRGVRGIPAELGDLRYRIVLPTIPGLDQETVTVRDADYLLDEPYFWLETLF